jgi:Ribosomal protein L19
LTGLRFNGGYYYHCCDIQNQTADPFRFTGKKKLKVIPAPPSALKTCKDPVAAIQESQLAVLDPTGERKALFDYRRNPRSVKVGDILRVTFKSGDPFSGVCLNIRSRGIDTSFLLRNNLTRVGVEMWIKVFSPNVESVEIVQRTEKRKRRARLYYMRYVLDNSISPSYFDKLDLPLLCYGEGRD